MREQEHQRGRSIHHHDKHAAHKSGHRPDDPHGVTAGSSPEGNSCDVCGASETGTMLTDKCSNCNSEERGH